jgi:hypothetical protein
VGYWQIDVAVEYLTESNKPKYFGVEIDEVSARQQLVPNGVAVSEAHKSSEIQGEVKNIRAYFGARVEDTQGSLAQFTRNSGELRKKYMISKTSFNMLYNFGENHLSVGSSNVQIDFEDIFVSETLSLVKFLTTHLNDKPPLRPGEGELKLIKLGDYPEFRVRQGTLLWWQKIGNNIIERFKRKPNSNILNNTKFRKYLYCLLYRYTYGAQPEL